MLFNFLCFTAFVPLLVVDMYPVLSHVFLIALGISPLSPSWVVRHNFVTISPLRA